MEKYKLVVTGDAERREHSDFTVMAEYITDRS